MNKNGSLAGKPDISHWDFPSDGPSAEVYQHLLTDLNLQFENIQKDRFSLHQFDEYLARVTSAFRLDDWGLFRVFMEGRVYTSSTASNTLNVALVLFLYAQGCGWEQGPTNQLVRAALLQDVGMLFLPPELLTKNGKLTEKERGHMESHPAISFEYVRKWGESYESTQVAIQHHEEWNGTGYPSQLASEKIHPWARASSVAVNFVARVTQRKYRNSLVGYEAIKQLLKDQGTRFDPVVVKDFIRALGLNPPGSILLLSDGSIARVVEMTKDNIIRPKIRVLIDTFGNVFRDDRGPILDLTEHPKLFIARPVNFQDLLEAREYQNQG